MAKIDEVIARLDKEIAILEHTSAIRVVVPIEDELELLRDVLALAKDEKRGKRYDLVTTIGSHITATYKKNGTVISAGSNILQEGDILSISLAVEEGYSLVEFKVNDKSHAGPEYTFEVKEDIKVVARAASSNKAISSVSVEGVSATKDEHGDWSVTLPSGTTSVSHITVTMTDAHASYELVPETFSNIEHSVRGNIEAFAEDGSHATYSLLITIAEAE